MRRLLCEDRNTGGRGGLPPSFLNPDLPASANSWTMMMMSSPFFPAYSRTGSRWIGIEFSYRSWAEWR